MSEVFHGFQGDVILVTAAVPAGATSKSKSSRGYVLAEGEATGHAHTVTDDIQLFEKEGTLYIKADGSFTIQHEEHRAVTVPAGSYEVRIAREFDHFAEEARKVID